MQHTMRQKNLAHFQEKQRKELENKKINHVDYPIKRRENKYVKQKQTETQGPVEKYEKMHHVI